MVASYGIIAHFLLSHQVLLTASSMALFNLGVTSMPSPDAASGKFYRWTFTVLHGVLLMLPRVFAQFKAGDISSGAQ